MTILAPRRHGQHASPSQIAESTGDGDAATSLDVLAVADPWDRARLAGELAARLQTRVALALEIRRAAVRELVQDHGTSRSTVARLLGVTSTRVSQLLAAGQTATADREVA